MWVFGYGSLMGDGLESHFKRSFRMPAILKGYRWAFDRASIRNWGAKAHPCPTLNVVKSDSSSCRGIAFEFPRDVGIQVRAYLVEREGKSFDLHALSVRLDSGADVNALVPLYAGPNLLPEGDLQAIAAMIVGTRGTHGSGVDHVIRAAGELLKAGVDDPVVTELASIPARLAP